MHVRHVSHIRIKHALTLGQVKASILQSASGHLPVCESSSRGLQVVTFSWFCDHPESTYSGRSPSLALYRRFC